MSCDRTNDINWVVAERRETFVYLVAELVKELTYWSRYYVRGKMFFFNKGNTNFYAYFVWLLALKFGNLENCYLCSLCTAASPLKRSRISFEEGGGGGGAAGCGCTQAIFFVHRSQTDFLPFLHFSGCE